MSHRPFTTAITAAVLLAAVAAPATASPPPAPSPSVARTARAVPNPVPQAWRGALAAARRAGSTRRSAAAAPVSATLPKRIVIADPVVDLPYTVDVGPGYANPAVAIDLRSEFNGFLAGAYVEGAPSQQVFSGSIRVSADTLLLEGIGLAGWAVVAGEKGAVPTGDVDALVPTRIGLRAIAAQRSTRRGELVTVAGAAKLYLPPSFSDEEYVGLGQERALLQRYTSHGWVTLRTLRTDDDGHVTTTVRIPFRAALRVVVPDTDYSFAVTTATTVL